MSSLDELVTVTVSTTNREAISAEMSLRRLGDVKALQAKTSGPLQVPVTVMIGPHKVTFPPGRVMGVW